MAVQGAQGLTLALQENVAFYRRFDPDGFCDAASIGRRSFQNMIRV
jgi:hypothetical protein